MHTNTAKEPVITLTLPLSQVNIVLQGLGELPLKLSRPATQNIEQQAQQDLQRQQEFMAKADAPQTPSAANEASKEAGAQG